MNPLQRFGSMPLLWAGMVVVVGYFACTVMWAIYERCKR